MPKLPSFLGIRRGLQSEIKDEETNDHVEIDFSVPAPTPNGSSVVKEEGDKKPEVMKPQGKVSPFTNMHHKLNFIPHNQRGKLNAQFLATLPGVLKIAELVSKVKGVVMCVRSVF